jgi:hypothetical protein
VIRNTSTCQTLHPLQHPYRLNQTPPKATSSNGPRNYLAAKLAAQRYGINEPHSPAADTNSIQPNAQRMFTHIVLANDYVCRIEMSLHVGHCKQELQSSFDKALQAFQMVCK